jgi:hypothetical protein
MVFNVPVFFCGKRRGRSSVGAAVIFISPCLNIFKPTAAGHSRDLARASQELLKLELFLETVLAHVDLSVYVGAC